MAAHKGHKKAGGRRKGSVNKTTASVKAALTEAFDGLGGVRALMEWGEANKSLFYPLWVRIAPQEHDITSKGESIAGLAAAAFAMKPDKTE